MPTLEHVHRRGTRAAQPLAADVSSGTIYYVTDEQVTERSNGTAWESITDGSALAALQQQIDDLRARVEALEA